MTLNNQNIFWHIVPACFSGFQSAWVVEKAEEKEVQDEATTYSVSHHVGAKHKKASSFSQKTSVWGKREVPISSAPHSAHDSHSWSLLGGSASLLNSSSLFLGALHKSGPACTCILDYYCSAGLSTAVASTQQCRGLRTKNPFVCLPTNSFSLPLSMASSAQSVRSLAFYPSKPSTGSIYAVAYSDG